MAVQIGALRGRILIQIAGGVPVEVGTIEIPVDVGLEESTRGPLSATGWVRIRDAAASIIDAFEADQAHEHIYGYEAGPCLTCGEPHPDANDDSL